MLKSREPCYRSLILKRTFWCQYIITVELQFNKQTAKTKKIVASAEKSIKSVCMFETSNEFRPKPSLVRKFMCTAWQSKGKKQENTLAYHKNFASTPPNGSHTEINICRRSLEGKFAIAVKQACVLDFSINKLTFSVCGWHLSRSIKSTDGRENILWNIKLCTKTTTKSIKTFNILWIIQWRAKWW